MILLATIVSATNDPRGWIVPDDATDWHLGICLGAMGFGEGELHQIFVKVGGQWRLPYKRSKDSKDKIQRSSRLQVPYLNDACQDSA